jgi:hypothetical protein
VRTVAFAPGARPLLALQRLLGRDSLTIVGSVRDFTAALAAGEVRWTVLDPMSVSLPAFDAATDAVADAGVRVIFCTSLAGFDLRRLLKVQSRLLPELVFRETDDDWRRLAAVLRLDAESVCARVAAGLVQRIGAPRDPLRGRTLGLFGRVPTPLDVEALAACCGEKTTHVRAEYRRAGLAPPHDVIDVARLAGAYPDLRDRSLSLSATTERHGFGTARTLERRSKALVALPGRRAGLDCDESEFARRLTAAAMR